MSISEQIKKLRELAKDYSDWGIGIKRTDRILREAADTIESLSAKLTGMERKTEDCGGGWIYCGDGENLTHRNDKGGLRQARELEEYGKRIHNITR